MLLITDSDLTGNQSGHEGGAVFSSAHQGEASATVEIERSAVSSNTASRSGGGIHNKAFQGDATAELSINQSTIANNGASFGGGIWNNAHQGNASADAVITRSTIAGNMVAEAAGGLGNDAFHESARATTTVNTSTVSGNSAGIGGGASNQAVFDMASARLVVTSSTIAGNSASDRGGGIWNYDVLSEVRIENTIVAGDSAPTGPDVHGQVSGDGHNLIGNSSGASGLDAMDMQNIDPLLGPLADNGGPTLTRALLDGSPAIDAGLTAETSDQRGAVRPRDGNGDMLLEPDIGSFER
jgi:hypothetical protein